MNRQPAVANRFYAGDPKILAADLARLVPTLPDDQKEKAFAVIAPHAGYVYSGAVAGETMSQARIPKHVVLLGPNHHGNGEKAAVMTSGTWQMPLGPVLVSTELASSLAAHCPLLIPDDIAHQNEHSLEVQVPFLHYLQPDVQIAPICLALLPYDQCVTIGKAIAAAIRAFKEDVLLVASTDMTHYESRQAATKKDGMAIRRILALDPAGLYQTVKDSHISMCGIIPTTIALVAAKELGAKRARLVRYSDSGETSGDLNQVVGYAGLIVQ